MNEMNFNHSGDIIANIVDGSAQLTEYGESLLKKIVIPLAPITKKNSQKIHINHRTGRRYIAPSDTVTIYQNKCLEYLYPFINNAEHFNYPVNVKCLFYMPTRRRVDLTNLLEAIDDILTHYLVIEDDDAQHVGGHDGSRVYLDKNNPRTEIVITPLDGGRCSEVIESKCEQCKNKINKNRINPCLSCKYDDSLNDNFEPIKDGGGRFGV